MRGRLAVELAADSAPRPPGGVSAPPPPPPPLAHPPTRPLAASGTAGLELAGAGLSAIDVQVTLLTLEPSESPSETTWLTEIGKITPAPAASPTSPMRCDSHAEECGTTWDEVTSRSYIEVTAVDGSSAASASAAQDITDHVAWDRYLR